MDFFTHCSTKRRPDGGWRAILGGRLLAMVLGVAGVHTVHAAAIEDLSLAFDEDSLLLSSVINLELGPAVEDAVMRSVPVYFVAQADVFRDRWYWSDKRVASASRTYRLAYQSLTQRWRVSMASGAGPGLQYALHQNHASLSEAMSTVTRLSSWSVADRAQLAPDARYRLEFRFKLDMALLPRPFQLVFNGQSDWNLDLRRTVSVPLLPTVAPEAVKVP